MGGDPDGVRFDPKRRRVVTLIAGVAGLILAVAAWASWESVLVEKAFQQSVAWRPTTLYAMNGKDPAIALHPDARGRLRAPVALNDVPVELIQAVESVEDRRFRTHSGVDFVRIGGALSANLAAGSVVQGGSTLTQQLVRTLYLSRARSLLRKLREAVAAVALERRHSKDEILGAYLNEIYLGQAGALAIHGVGAAARHHFGKDVADLSLAQSALLAGIIAAPHAYAPARNPDAARLRRNRVLRKLGEFAGLDSETLQAAADEPLPAPSDTYRAPYFRDFAFRALARDWGVAELTEGGLDVTTTLDPKLQAIVENAAARRLAEIARLHPELAHQQPPLQVAVVLLEPGSGALRALVGGRNYQQSEYDRATVARRQPGSAFKPIVALAAFSDPKQRFSLVSSLQDTPLRIELESGPWQPENHDHRFRGRVSLRHALEQSLNVPLVRLAQAVGLDRVIETARSLGIESPMHDAPSLALGAFEVNLLELTGAYATLASGFEARRRSASPRPARPTWSRLLCGAQSIAEAPPGSANGDFEGPSRQRREAPTAIATPGRWPTRRISQSGSGSDSTTDAPWEDRQKSSQFRCWPIFSSRLSVAAERAPSRRRPMWFASEPASHGGNVAAGCSSGFSSTPNRAADVIPLDNQLRRGPSKAHRSRASLPLGEMMEY